MPPIPRHPRPDAYPDTPDIPVDWTEIPLGPGQSITGRQGDFQHADHGDPLAGTDVRQTPGRDHGFVVHRPPQSPA